jgi:uncharacterized protein
VDITPTIPRDRQYVQRYDAAGFRINGVDHVGSVIVLPERTTPWPVVRIDQIDATALQPVLDAAPRPELLIIGCGRRGAPPNSSLRATLKAYGIALELMDTGAACRTYNALIGEGRRVAAALIVLGT